MEAAKSVPYRRLMLRAVQLSSEVYSSCGGERLQCNVLCQLRPLNFQYLYHLKPLEILTSLCCYCQSTLNCYRLLSVRLCSDEYMYSDLYWAAVCVTFYYQSSLTSSGLLTV